MARCTLPRRPEPVAGFPQHMGKTLRELVDARHGLLARLQTAPDGEAELAFLNAEIARHAAKDAT